MTGALTGGHIHGPAAAGANADVIVPFNTTGAGASGTLTGTFTSTNTVNDLERLARRADDARATRT